MELFGVFLSSICKANLLEEQYVGDVLAELKYTVEGLPKPPSVCPEPGIQGSSEDRDDNNGGVLRCDNEEDDTNEERESFVEEANRGDINGEVLRCDNEEDDTNEEKEYFVLETTVGATNNEMSRHVGSSEAIADVGENAHMIVKDQNIAQETNETSEFISNMSKKKKKKKKQSDMPKEQDPATNNNIIDNYQENHVNEGCTELPNSQYEELSLALDGISCSVNSISSSVVTLEGRIVLNEKKFTVMRNLFDKLRK